MNRRNDAGSREERPEDREGEGHDYKDVVPCLQHRPPPLHNSGVNECRSRNPREERRVLNGIPRPVPAPSEHLVAPPATEKNAGGEEDPGDQRPAMRSLEPGPLSFGPNQCGDCERKRHGKADVADVQKRRVDRHQNVIRKERIRTDPVSRRRGRREREPRRLRAEAVHDFRADRERVRGGRHKSEPKHRDRTHDPQRQYAEPVAGLDGSPHQPREHGEHEAPQHDAPLERRPAGGEQEDERRAQRRVLRNVGHAEVVEQDADLEDGEGSNSADRETVGRDLQTRRIGRRILGDTDALNDEGRRRDERDQD